MRRLDSSKNRHHAGESAGARRIYTKRASFQRQEEREKGSALGHFDPVAMGKLRARGPANRQTGGLTHAPTEAVTQGPCRQGPGGKRTWRENPALNCASLPPLANFRRLGNVTALRPTIRSRPSAPASVVPP